MITAVDTSVMLDVLGADSTFGLRSSEAIRRCRSEGSLTACDVVWAEVGAWFPTPLDAEAVMQRLTVTFSPIGADTALLAGTLWRAYRSLGGSRTQMIPDFLVGAHAQAQADRLLTRDRGFYRAYFRDLEILDPTAGG